MMTLAMISVLVGMVLGQRFNILILVPTMAIALIFAVGVGIARDDTFWRIVLLAVAVASSLQVGYLAGIVIRHVLVAARSSRSPATSLTGSANPHPSAGGRS